MLGIFLAFAAGLSATQWIELVSLIPAFVELGKEAEPVIKKGIEDVQKAVTIIEGHKSTGLSHFDAVMQTRSELLTDLTGWNDNQATQWQNNIIPGGPA